MYVTLSGGLAAAVLDPLLIFGLDLGIDGAAISTVLSRFVLLAVGLHGAHVVHRLVRLPDLKRLTAVARPFFAIGGPAVATQIATPVGNAYVTYAIAGFGDDAVAGWAIIGRVLPVAFGFVFALSGAVGPILGQNFGAGRFDRLRQVMRDALMVTTLYVLAVWLLLALFANQIAALFGASPGATDLIVFFCLFAAGSFLFNGSLFVANAAFNNLGFPGYATLFNWGRSTLGVVPFVWMGAKWYGAEGVIAGWGLGAVVFGLGAVIVCFRVVRKVGETPPPPEDRLPGPPPTANSPFSSGKAATFQ
jgi:Na+-driven multidrug efflux pump